MDFQRLILFGALGMVLLLLWQSWLEYESGKNGAAMNANTPASQVSGAAQDTTTATKPEADDVPQAPAVSAAPETSDTAAAIPLSQSLPGERRVIAETDIIRAEIDTRGGDLRRLALLTYPVSLDEPDTPFVLLNDSGADLFLIQDGLLSAGREAPNHHTIFSTERQNVRLSPGEDSVQVHLEWTSDDGVVFRKTFTFHRNSYYIDVAFTVDNQSSDQWVGYRYSQILRTQVAEPSSGLAFLDDCRAIKAAPYLPRRTSTRRSTSRRCTRRISPDPQLQAGSRCCSIISWVLCSPVPAPAMSSTRMSPAGIADPVI